MITDFIDNSNRKAKPKFEREYRLHRTITRWCKKHPTGTWGDGFTYCSQGYMTMDCIEGERG